MSQMDIMQPAMAVAFTASIVWIVVRIVKRREWPLAKWVVRSVRRREWWWPEWVVGPGAIRPLFRRFQLRWIGIAVLMLIGLGVQLRLVRWLSAPIYRQQMVLQYDRCLKRASRTFGADMLSHFPVATDFEPQNCRFEFDRGGWRGGGAQLILHKTVGLDEMNRVNQYWTAQAVEIYYGDFKGSTLTAFNRPDGVPIRLYSKTRGFDWPDVRLLILRRSGNTAAGIAISATKGETAKFEVSYWVESH
jgi:hypothetical protein